MRTNHNASGKPSLEGCVGLRYQLRLVLQATYPWVCGILTSDIENTIDQLDKSTVEKVIDDVSGRMINAYGDKKERLEEVQKAADEYVKGDKMDLNQDEISYDDDDDHDDH